MQRKLNPIARFNRRQVDTVEHLEAHLHRRPLKGRDRTVIQANLSVFEINSDDVSDAFKHVGYAHVCACRHIHPVMIRFVAWHLRGCGPGK